MEQVGKATHFDVGTQPGFPGIFKRIQNYIGTIFILLGLTGLRKSCCFRAVNLIRLFLSAFYLLLLVLLPWLHMPLHGQSDDEQVHTSHACDHHHSDEKPTQENDGCQLCSLAVVSIDLPQIFSIPEALYTLTDASEYAVRISEPRIHVTHAARAPPYWTV